jgi:hypothetical protein
MSEYLDKRTILMEGAEAAAILCWLNRIYGNAKFKKALYSTAIGVPSGWVAFAPLEGSEIRIDWVKPRSKGSVKVKPGPGEHTCEFSCKSLRAAYPYLEVEPGWALPIPFRIEGGRMLLDLKDAEMRPSIPAEQKWARARRMNREE